MKKKIFMATVVILGAIFFTGMTVNDARAFDISFDGYCDGMAINIDGGRLYGERTGGTGCAAAGIAMIGDFGLLPSAGGLALALTTDNSADPTLPQIYYIFFDKTWKLYVWQGPSTPPILFNSGTWSFGSPALAGEGESPAVSDVD